MTSHICDHAIPVCTCGRRWEFRSTWPDGTVTYTSRWVRDSYIAIFGRPGPRLFEPVEATP